MNIKPKPMNGWMSRGVLLVVLLVLDIVEPEATCHFPQFLQSSNFDGRKTWSTRKWWLNLRHQSNWKEKYEISVKNGFIRKQRHAIKENCKRTQRRTYRARLESCMDTSLVFNQTCISQEGKNTYRVIEYNNKRDHRFRCLRFVQRSDNIVQVYEGPYSDTNDTDLCKRNFTLNKWPWIAPWNKAARTCPVSGGFSFRTIRRLTNEDLCENEWRRSTLEIECLRGDGLMFMAPKTSKCNPFTHGDNKKLLCWADWTSQDFIFMVASDVGRQPSYCLRFPRIQEGEFSVMVYFSVICPTEPDGKPPAGIEYYELKMRRKDPSICTDDNQEKCLASATSEACANDQNIYPHCARTCRLCTTTVTENLRRRRCGFDPNLSGDFVLYDKIGAHNVSVNTQEVNMTHLSTFNCLGVGTINNNTVYKTASLFDNGCSARYTCLEMKRRSNNILQYRIGPSYREELKIEELCVFKDDPPPLGDSIRSVYMKNLILARKVWASFCGLSGTIAFNGTINGRNCEGTVSDWDEKECTHRGVMSFRSSTCKPLILTMDFQCLGVIEDKTIPLVKLLLTRSMDGSHSYNCWVRTEYFDQAQWPKPMMYQTPFTQCSLLMEVQKKDYSLSPINVYLDAESKHKNCMPEDKVNMYHTTQIEVTKSSNVTYILPNKQSTDRHQEIHIQPDSQKADTNTNSPYQPLLGSASYFMSHNYYLINVLIAILVYVLFINPGS